MPTQLTIQTGVTVTPTANAADATGNFVVPADSRQDVAIRINNGSAGAITVTLDDVNTATPEGAQSFNPDVQLAVPAGAARYFVIQDTTRFLNPANGRISWTYSAAATVTVEVVGLS